MIGRTWKVSRRAWKLSIQAHTASGEQSKAFRHSLRWAALAGLRPSAMEEWLTFLERPEIRPLVEANPRMPFRPLSRYLSLRWNCDRRVKVMRDTYEFVSAQSGHLLEAMLKPGGMCIAKLELGRDQAAEVRFNFDQRFRKEGEFGVFLWLTGVADPVSSLAFSLEYTAGEGWTCLVGAVQGRIGGGEEVIKLATKAFHGLRPKQLMVVLAQEISRALRLSHLLGVGNAIHVVRGERPRLPELRLKGFRMRLIRRGIQFDYDELWQDVGGTLRPDGWFELPLRTKQRAPEEIKPNKRGQYARRYALLDELSRQLRIVFTPFKHS